MQVPKCSEIKLECIKCGERIFHDEDTDAHVNVGVWKGAIVTTAFASFKSKLQGSAFVIGVCDTCLTQAEIDKKVVCFYDNYSTEMPHMN